MKLAASLGAISKASAGPDTAIAQFCRISVPSSQGQEDCPPVNLKTGMPQAGSRFMVNAKASPISSSSTWNPMVSPLLSLTLVSVSLSVLALAELAVEKPKPEYINPPPDETLSSDSMATV